MAFRLLFTTLAFTVHSAEAMSHLDEVGAGGPSVGVIVSVSLENMGVGGPSLETSSGSGLQPAHLACTGSSALPQHAVRTEPGCRGQRRKSARDSSLQRLESRTQETS